MFVLVKVFLDHSTCVTLNDEHADAAEGITLLDCSRSKGSTAYTVMSQDQHQLP